MVNGLPYSMRKAWREVADDISSNQSRDITFDDLAEFVERKARAQTHPIFGEITRDQNPALKVPKGRISFGVDGESSSKDDDITNRTAGGTESEEEEQVSKMRW